MLTREQAVETVKLISALEEYADASKIQNTFIKAFIEKSVRDALDQFYLTGSFNLGGTVSGRLSSSDPNLQNIPSNSKHAKLIKKCFQMVKPGWIFAGADFSSLEDRISALTTKDPNKLKVYTDGYDGHCLRAYYYFHDQMPDIENTVECINSIAEKYPHLRQNSKAPTFALTYQGTWKTILHTTGLPEHICKQIEANYHEMYRVSDEWVRQKLIEASQTGYVTVAFGLRLRTPRLAKTVFNPKYMHHAAKKEMRTAGNALGQSYGLLNNRAAIEFQERLWKSKYIMDIRPVAHIHDAQYFIVREDPEVIKWFNDNLVECMEWQELPEIKHPEVKLGGNVELYYPSWAEKYELPNRASEAEIQAVLDSWYETKLAA